MKKLIVLLTTVFIYSMSFAEIKLWTAGSEDIRVPDINIYTSFNYDIQNDILGNGVFSDILRYKYLDLGIGAIRNIDNEKYGSVSLNLSLDRLCEEYKINIEYLWKNILKTSIGMWVGYNSLKKDFSFGIMCVMIKIDTKKKNEEK